MTDDTQALRYYVLCVHPEHDPFPLSLDGYAMHEEARSLVRWMHQGQCDGPRYPICRIVPDAPFTFEDVETGERHVFSSRGCYTKAAWARFTSKWNTTFIKKVT